MTSAARCLISVPRYRRELRGVARSSFEVEHSAKSGDEMISAEIRKITDKFEGYGYRRVGAELSHRGLGSMPRRCAV